MKVIAFFAAVLAAQSWAADCADRDEWSGREVRIAKVNEVGVEPGENLLRLRGEWEFVAKSVPYRAYTPWKDKGFWNGSRKIEVPGCWECRGVGEEGMSHPWACSWDCEHRKLRHVYKGNGWFRRTVKAPESWRGKRVWLKVGGVNSKGWFFVNGGPAGQVYSYCGSYKFDVSDLVKPGEDVEVMAMVSNEAPSRRGGFGSCNRWGGIWRDVELECAPAAGIDDVWVRGDYDARVAEVHVTVSAASALVQDGELQLEANVGGVREPLTAVRCGVNPSEAVIRVPLAEFRPWSPEHPHLYVAEVTLKDGEGMALQTWKERFGVRKLEARGKEFYLNGKPFFVREVGWHPEDPINGVHLPDREAFKTTIRKIKSAGFNMARFHTRCEFAEVFEAADELGLMLEPELPYYFDDPCDNQVLDPCSDAKELFEHFRRHVSFSVYSGGNEGHFGEVMAKRLYSEVKGRDPDRLMVEQDGGGLEKLWKPLFCPKFPRGTGDFVSGPVTTWAPGTFNPDFPFVTHEYMNLCVKASSRIDEGYTGLWMPCDMRKNRMQFLEENGISEASGDKLEVAQNVLQKSWQKEGIEMARRDPYCDGYSYWSLQDVMSPQKGSFTGPSLFDLFLREKEGGSKASDFAVFNSPSCLLLDVSGGQVCYAKDPRKEPPEGIHPKYDTWFDQTNRVLTAGDAFPARVMLAHYGDRALPAGKLLWRIEGGGKTLASGEVAVGVQELGAVRTIAELKLTAPEVQKAVAARLELEFGGISNSWPMWIFPRRKAVSGAGIAASPTLLPHFRLRYPGIVSTEDSGAEKAGVVLAVEGSDEAKAAAERGAKVVTFKGWEGRSNSVLGWWWMGSQMGSVLTDHPALALLPHGGFFDQLLFRIGRVGTPLPVAGVVERDLVMFGEGGDHCYLYLAAQEKGGKAVGFMVSGLDLVSDTPEGTAILDGIINWLGR